MKHFTPNDKLFYKAKQDGYRARSAYKLLEIQDKFGILKKGQSVLDLGAYPGSWLQVTKDIIGDTGKIIGVDLKKIDKLKGIRLYECDVFSDDMIGVMKSEDIKCFDIILSDMAPNTSGVQDIDQYKSVELNLRVLELCKKYLKTGGYGVFKIFKGEDFNDFFDEAKHIMPHIKVFKPKACRDRSVEVYCIGKRVN